MTATEPRGVAPRGVVSQVTLTAPPKEWHNPPVGALGREGVFRVGRGGQLMPDGASWSLAWRVGAVGWRDPATDRATRRETVGTTPCRLFRMRVPDGEVIWRIGATPGPDGGCWAVTEVENTSPNPLALALIIESGGPAAPGGPLLGVPDVSVGSDGVIQLDGRPTVWASVPPVRSVPSADQLQEVLDPAKAVGPTSPGEPVLVFALPHRNRIRFLARVDVADRAAPRTRGWFGMLRRSAERRGAADGVDTEIAPSAGAGPPSPAPEVEHIARGWDTLVGRGTRVETGDAALDAAVAHAIGSCLLAAERPEARYPLETAPSVGSSAGVATSGGFDVPALAAGGPALALARFGFADTALEVLRHTAPPMGVASAGLVAGGSWIAALMTVAGAQGWTEIPDELLLATGRAVRDLVRSPPTWVPGVPTEHTSQMLIRCGQPDLARLVARRGADVARRDPRGEPSHVAALVWPAPGVSVDRWWARPELSADLLTTVFDCCVADRAAGLELCPQGAPAPGVNIAVHSLPTSHGLLSYAVRWHGDRPALLWELAPRADSPDNAGSTPLVTAEAIDPAFGSNEPVGETLGRPHPLR